MLQGGNAFSESGDQLRHQYALAARISTADGAAVGGVLGFRTSGAIGFDGNLSTLLTPQALACAANSLSTSGSTQLGRCLCSG